MKLKILIILFLLLTPVKLLAQNLEAKNEEMFKAEVVEIMEEKKITRDNGSISIQQKLKVLFLKEYFFLTSHLKAKFAQIITS